MALLDATAARAAILSAIRTGNRDLPPPAAPLVPPRLAFDEPPVARWQRLWQSRAGTVEPIARREDLPAAVARWCAESGVSPPTLASATLLDLPWPAEWGLRCAPADVATHTAVSEAYAGVAEVGNLVFLSAPQHPTTHRFVPDTHLVLLSAARIVRDFEAVWALLRSELGQGGEGSDWRAQLPRTINFVAGPSRTGDVEQTIQMGAHGPRRVHLFLIP